MKKTTKKFYVFAVLNVITFAQCSEKIEMDSAQIIAIPVEHAMVTKTDMQEYITFNGISKYTKKEIIRANITGFVSKINFNLGDKTYKNQPFASIRTKEQDALKTFSKIDTTFKQTLEASNVKTNENGIVTLLNVNKNDYVSEGDVLATISQPSSLIIQVNIPFQYHDFIQIGTVCEIQLPTKNTIQAKISGELPTIDPIAQAQAFLIALPNENLPENLKVNIRFILKENKNALVVPRNAIQTNELLSNFWVMKLIADTLAVKTPVNILIQNDSLVEISSQLISLGDKVITKGSYQLQDSTFVKIK
ncbi:hypothetical protein DNU06_05790 [Putridiphycobacter roseus]|uniref:RND efflux pump membrane fusion protein barrel-sandwich domain-containing protein n=1 Tax=Putridiphycobacter roseus TaxID=2219161 RepID=A0A2W1N1I5_9FLAO|nr:efflux RND transporter periplasmic adaptor subunit [Putridiphycobacter roseus]PZE18127.1 hypothetical protein DNU06_05790 [Putridiphycobacter roseus]